MHVHAFSKTILKIHLFDKKKKKPILIFYIYKEIFVNFLKIIKKLIDENIMWRKTCYFFNFWNKKNSKK
jgi:hypothetical protein